MSAKLALMPSGHRHRSLPQSSSASRFTAGAFGFFILSQPGQPWALACLRAARSHRRFAQATFSPSQEWNQSACHGLKAIGKRMLAQIRAENTKLKRANASGAWRLRRIRGQESIPPGGRGMVGHGQPSQAAHSKTPTFE